MPRRNPFLYVVLGSLGLLIAAGCTPPRDPYPSATPQRVVNVTQRIFPAVVRLDVKQEIYSEGKRSESAGIGSGVIISGEGHILTNFHVAGRALEIHATLANKERVRAKLVGDDHWTDLAIVQLDMADVRKRNIAFTAAEMGSSKGLLPGQDVMAIGTPFGLARTITLGVVSNNERTFYPQQNEIDGYETGTFNNWIQMDTPINPGNSGGPLVDLEARIVGINTRGGAQNLNFAVPIDIAREVAETLIRNAATAASGEPAKVIRSDLGVDLKPMQDMEAFFETDINQGVLINSVERNSPAAKAGLRPKDILLEVNAKPINVRFPEQIAPVMKAIADLPVGTSVKLKIKRDKEVRELTAVTEKLESAVGQEKEFGKWGLTVRDITRAYANARQLDDDLGVVVTTLSPGRAAAKAELQVGDIIRKVSGKPIDDLDGFVKAYKSSRDKNEKAVLLDLKRGRNSQQVLVKLND